MKRISTIVAFSMLVSASSSFAQAKPAAPAAAPAQAQSQPAQLSAGITPPADYVIGAGDVLIINYWKDAEMTLDAAVVRPDGKITLPLLNDVDAAGRTPEQLREQLMKASVKILEDPRVTVGIRQINSRKVYITGAVGKSGQFDLLTPMTVMQMISMAGGLKEFTSGKNITILRQEPGAKPAFFKFNYQEVVQGKKLEQNIQLKPGDTITVPE
jgi:polysaccharide export outer membrane protein